MLRAKLVVVFVTMNPTRGNNSPLSLDLREGGWSCVEHGVREEDRGVAEGAGGACSVGEVRNVGSWGRGGRAGGVGMVVRGVLCCFYRVVSSEKL